MSKALRVCLSAVLPLNQTHQPDLSHNPAKSMRQEKLLLLPQHLLHLVLLLLTPCAAPSSPYFISPSIHRCQPPDTTQLSYLNRIAGVTTARLTSDIGLGKSTRAVECSLAKRPSILASTPSLYAPASPRRGSGLGIRFRRQGAPPGWATAYRSAAGSAAARRSCPKPSRSKKA